MATPEDIEIAKVARDVQVKREEEAAPPEMALTGPVEDYGIPATDWNYKPQETMLDYTGQAPMVIEGELPPLRSVEEAEMAGAQQAEMAKMAGAWGAFPTQARADATVAEIAGDQTPYYGPMSADPLEVPDYGIAAFDPNLPSDFLIPEGESFADQAIPAEEQFAPAEANLTDPAAAAVSAGANLTDPAAAAVSAGAPVATPQTEEEQRKEFARKSLAVLKVGRQGYARIIQAEKANAVLAQQQGREAAAAQRGYQDQTELQNQERLTELRHQQEQVNKQVLSIQTAYNDIGDFKVDRENWWNSRSTGQKVAAAISLLISSWQQGKAGKTGPGPVGQMLFKAIENDIDDQKAEYNAKRGKAADKKSMFGVMMAKFGNERDAYAATQAVYLNDVNNKLSTIATKYSGTQVGINSEKAIGLIEIKQQQSAAAIYKIKMDGLSTLRDQGRKDRKETREEEQHETAQAEYLVPLWDKNGKQFKARSKAAQKEIETGVADQAYLRKNIDRMIEKIKLYGISEVFKPSQLKADLEAMATIQRGKLRLPILGPGTVQEYERELLKELSPTGTAVTGPGRRAAIFKLRALQREADLAWQETLIAKLRGNYIPVPMRLKLEPVAKKQRK